jgi:hypothetical protein
MTDDWSDVLEHFDCEGDAKKQNRTELLALMPLLNRATNALPPPLLRAWATQYTDPVVRKWLAEKADFLEHRPVNLLPHVNRNEL